MGNIISFVALVGWPLVTLVLFMTLSTSRAIACSLLAAYLVLPAGVGYDFKGVPTLDKGSISSLAAFVMALGTARSFKWPRSLPVNLLMAAYVLGPFLTGLTNRDPITIGSIQFPEVSLYTDFSWAAGRAIELMPFLLGAGLMSNEKAHRDLLLFFVLGAMAYSAPVLFEVVKGPFLQQMIYGFSFGEFYMQQVRGDSFRAMVFLGHGLLVATYLSMAILAAIGLWRSKQRVWIASGLFCAIYLFVVLAANKSVGATLFALLFAPLLAFLAPRRFLLVALALAVMVVTYPVLRANHLVPVESIMSMTSNYSQDRANSFGLRLTNEEMLLNRAKERSAFGWGGFGRNRIWVVTNYGETKDVSITDGTWIITMGTSGWLGYLSLFGLLCYPFFHLFRMRRQLVSPATTALAAMLLINLLDLIPNSSLRPVTWLVAGALAGLARTRRSARAAQLSAPAGIRGTGAIPAGS